MYSYAVEQAVKAAAVLHDGQVRKGTIPVPYVSHLVAVAFIVADYTKDENAVVAALLHDTLEDTDYTKDELVEDFGEIVADIVCTVTEPRGAGVSYKDYKAAYVTQLKTASQAALIVAAADKIHNLRTTIEQYHDHWDQFVDDFGNTLAERNIFLQNVSNSINARLKNDIVHEFNHVFTEYKSLIAHGEKNKP